MRTRKQIEKLAAAIKESGLNVWDSWVHSWIENDGQIPRAYDYYNDPVERERRLTNGLSLFGRTYPYNGIIKELGGIWDNDNKVWLVFDIESVLAVKKEIRRKNKNEVLLPKMHPSGYRGWFLIDKKRIPDNWDWDWEYPDQTDFK